jgi:hypothetical protein
MKKSGLTLGAVFVLFMPFASGASIQFTPAFNGAGVRLSFIVPEWYDVGFGVGAHADFSVLPLLHFYPSFEYSHAGSDIVDDYWSTAGHFNKYTYLNDFALNGDLRFYPRVGKLVVKPFVGGGIAFIVSNEYYSYVGVTDPNNRWNSSTNDVGLGLDLLSGLDIPIGNVIGNFEIKVKVVTGYTIFKMTGGVTFPLNGSSAQKRHSQEG